MSALELRHEVTGEPRYTIRITAPAKWLNANDRGSWKRHRATVCAWREMTGWAAARAGVKPMDRAYILAELRFADRRRRDPNNWSPTAKACVDGLVDARLLDDDDAAHLIGPDLRLGPVLDLGNGAVYLHVWPVT